MKRFSRFYFECSIVGCESEHTSDSCSQKQHSATNGSDPRDWMMVSIVHSTDCFCFHSAQTSFTKLMTVCLFPLKLVTCTSCIILTSDPQIHEISTISTFPISKLEVCRQCCRRLIGEVVRRTLLLLGPSPDWKCLLVLSHLRHY